MMKSHKLIWMVVCLLCITSAKAQTVTPTWADDIAPILYSNCTSCHHFGGLAPNPLMTYSDAYSFRFLIRQYTQSNYMPPWPPDAKYKHLAFERILADSQKDKIVQWVLGGAPEGNTANAPIPPVYSTSNSKLPSIDFTGKMPNYTVNTGTDLYRCFIINTNFTADQFASEIEVIPGNSSIVHHVLVYEDTTVLIKQKDSADVGPGYTCFFGTGSNDSRLVGEWVPGTQHIKFPAGMGMRLRKNTRLILQVHYPKGTYLKLDSTRVNIKFAANTSSPFFREVFLVPAISESNLVNGPLVIPPNVVKTFTAVATATIANPLVQAFTLLSVAPHMHLIGKSMKVFAKQAGTGDTIPLINIPQWDFKWQGLYNFRSPIKVMQGSTLIAQSAYDNTSANLSNPNSPPIQVTQGEATTNEMMLVFFAFTNYFTGDENMIIDASPLDVGIQEQSGIVNSLQIYNVFPNPAKTNAQLSYFSPAGSLGMARITSVDGKIMKEWPVSLQQGYGSVPMELEGLAKGEYFITLKTKTYTKTKPFLVYE